MRWAAALPRALVLAWVALLAMLAVFVEPGSSVPPFLPIGDYAAYDPASPAALVHVEPVVHAPWLGQPAWPIGMAASGAVLAALAMASLALGAVPAATLVVLAAVVSRPDLRVMLATAAPALLAVAGLWGSVMSARVPTATRRGWLWTLVLAAAALAIWPPVVVALPAVVAAVWAGSRGAGVAALVVGAALGVVVGLSRWAADAATIGSVPVSIADVWSVVTTTADRGTDPFVWPPLAAVRLPLIMMGAGAVTVFSRASRRWLLAGGLVASVACAQLVPAVWRAESLRALYWSAWPLAALGLSAFVGLAAPRGRRYAIAAMALVLVGGGVSASVREVEMVEPRAFAGVLSRALAEIGSGREFVAEDTRLDTALVAAKGRRLTRVRSSPLAVVERAATGATVLAAPSGRRALELWGLRFADRIVVETPVRLPLAAHTARLRCVPVAAPWRELPGLEFTGRLGVHLPTGSGRFEAVVVTTPPVAVSVTSPAGQPRGRLFAIKATLDTLPGVLWPRGAEPPGPNAAATRVELEASPAFATSVAIALGTRAPAVAVRFLDDARSPDVATVCAAPLPREDPLAHVADAAIALDDPAFFAGGWHGAEGAGAGAFRWTAQRALVLVPASAARAVTIGLDARAAVSSEPVTLTAVVNGWPAGTRAMPADGPRYEWPIPPSIWVDGTNEIAFEVSRTTRPSDTGGHDTRELGMLVTGIRLRRN